MGADLTVNSGRQDIADLMRDWTEGDGPSVVVEAVGHPRTIESAVQLVAAAGRVVIVGVTEEAAHIHGVDMTKKELTIYGSRNNLSLFKDAIRFVNQHRDLARTIVTDEFAFGDAIEAFRTAVEHPEQVCKVLLRW